MKETSSETDVSVVIVNWNTRDLLRDCLRSLTDHAGGLVLEVFVVDNDSSDGSADMVQTEFPGVTVLQNDSNLGFARAANRGLRESSGRNFLLLNSDARILPGSLQAMAAFLDREPKAAVCGPQLVYEDGRPQNSVSNFPTLATELLNKSVLRLLFPNRFPRKAPVGSEPREVESVIGAAMMVKARAVAEIGLLDEDYFFFLEETDWCYRFWREGWKAYQAPEAKVIHLQGKTAEKVHVPARIEYFRSRYTYFRKHRSPLANAILRFLLPLRLAMNVSANGVLSAVGFIPGKARERLRVYAGILGWHLRGCPSDGGLMRDGSEDASSPPQVRLPDGG